MIQAPEVVSSIKLIDRTARITTRPSYRFLEEGGRFRLSLRLESNLSKVRDELAIDLERMWRRAECTGDDLSTRGISIAPLQDGLRVDFNLRFVRWWSLSNCNFDRNHQFEADGPVAFTIRLDAKALPVRLSGSISHFEPKLRVFGLHADRARALARQELEKELTAALDKVNARLSLPPEIAAVQPSIKTVELRNGADGTLRMTLEGTALIGAEQLNKMLQLLLTGKQ